MMLLMISVVTPEVAAAGDLQAGVAKRKAAPTDVGKSAGWDIEAPPGPHGVQEIDTTEGTWMNLDVSPDGREIVFDLLGDIYLMPISGADGSGNVFPKKLTKGVDRAGLR